MTTSAGDLPYPLVARRQKRQTMRRQPFQVTLSADERETLQQRAAERGVSLARLLVESALSEGDRGDAPASDRRREQLAASNETHHQLAVVAQELNEIRRLLATVANNVNQLAKLANIAGDTTGMQQLAGTLADVDGLLVSLRRWSGSRQLAELPALLEQLWSTSGIAR